MSTNSKLSFDDTSVAFAYKSNGELKKAQWLFKMINSNLLTKIGTFLTINGMRLRLPLKPIIKPTIYQQFCGGETLNDCALTVNKLWEYGAQSCLDYGVEAKENEEEFDKGTAELIRALDFAAAHDHIPVISIKLTGIGKFALLEKVQNGEPLSEEEVIAFGNLKNRLFRLCRRGKEKNTAIFIDAEESWIQDTIDDLADKMMAQFNTEKCVVYNTFQLYRHDRLEFLKQSYQKAQEGNYILGAKLVRGAYMEKERERAEEMNYPSPIQPDKSSTDKDYAAALEYCFDRYEDIAFCAATHNEENCYQLAQLVEQHQVDKKHPHINFSQLYGMSDHISFNLSHAGFNMAKYVPYGPVKDVIPYLMRRAKENTSISGQMSRELSLITKEVKRRKSS